MLGAGDKSAPFCYGKFTLSKKSKIAAEAYKRSGYENLKYEFLELVRFAM